MTEDKRSLMPKPSLRPGGVFRAPAGDHVAATAQPRAGALPCRASSASSRASLSALRRAVRALRAERCAWYSAIAFWPSRSCISFFLNAASARSCASWEFIFNGVTPFALVARLPTGIHVPAAGMSCREERAPLPWDSSLRRSDLDAATGIWSRLGTKRRRGSWQPQTSDRPKITRGDEFRSRACRQAAATHRSSSRLPFQNMPSTTAPMNRKAALVASLLESMVQFMGIVACLYAGTAW